jgi:hypothetical protein
VKQGTVICALFLWPCSLWSVGHEFSVWMYCLVLVFHAKSVKVKIAKSDNVFNRIQNSEFLVYYLCVLLVSIYDFSPSVQ